MRIWDRIDPISSDSKSFEGQIEGIGHKNLKKFMHMFLRSLNLNPRLAWRFKIIWRSFQGQYWFNTERFDTVLYVILDAESTSEVYSLVTSKNQGHLQVRLMNFYQKNLKNFWLCFWGLSIRIWGWFNHIRSSFQGQIVEMNLI